MTTVRKLEQPKLQHFTPEQWKNIVSGKLGIEKGQKVLQIGCLHVREETAELEVTISVDDKMLTIRVTEKREFYLPSKGVDWGGKPALHDFKARKRFCDVVRDHFPEIDWESIREKTASERAREEYLKRQARWEQRYS